MNDKIHHLPTKQEREKALTDKRREILSASPEDALEAIAEYPYPVTLVQSLAEEDLHILVHTIGPDEAHPVLALASNQQWEYLMDVETWARDWMDSQAMTQWLERLLKSDPDRLTHWITHEKRDEFGLYLFRNIELYIREYDQDPSELGEEFFSEDETYYIRLRPMAKDRKQVQERRDLFLRDMLRRVSVYDYPGYRNMLRESASIVPAETEEELYRRRNVRLAEKGFLPFEEAVGVYQPLEVDDLHKRKAKTADFSGRPIDAYPLIVSPSGPFEASNLFTQTLVQVQDASTIQRLQAEFAGLSNRVIAADQLIIREKKTLAQVVQKVGDYISIGMQKTIAQTQDRKPYAEASLIQTYFLGDLFRVGYRCGLALKWKAQKWQKTSWFTNQGLPLSFWGETWMGILGGLLIKKPLYFDNYTSGELYREFATLDDIDQTETELRHIIAFDDLFSLMRIDAGPLRSFNLLSYQNLILTMWVNHHMNITGPGQSPVPLSMTKFRHFFKELCQPETQPAKVSDTMRELFLSWLAQESGLTTFAIAERMGPALEQLFCEIENELGSVAPENLDPRFIQLFLFNKNY